MGKVIDFDEKNVIKKSGGDYDFPRLKLDNKGDVARILVLENPTYEFVHNLQHPVVDEAGVPIMQTKQNKRGEDYTVHKMQYVSRPICTGDEGILAEKGLDPKNCLVCAYAEANPDRMKAPERRFAMHIFRYNTKKNGDLSTPFGGQVIVWAYTNRYFDKITELKKEWGDLRQRDLVITCENPAFQGYDIKIGANAEYLKDDKRKELVRETFVEDNMTADLSIFCGRATDERFLKQDLQKVTQFWSQVDRFKTGRTGTTAPTLDSAIDSLLDTESASVKDETPSWASAEPEASPADGGSAAPNLDDILAGL